MFARHISFTTEVQRMQSILQFKTLAELAVYSKMLSGKGFQINTLKLTIKTKLSEEDIKIAYQQYRATKIDQLYA
ncbi:hypothetical protein HRH25_15220 [Flavisolibacter sp. BT320]|nr:hypothetical protein [Flavisolibacter longurius]